MHRKIWIGRPINVFVYGYINKKRWIEKLD